MLKITWLGHTTFSLEMPNGEVVVIDPWIEGNPKFPAGYRFERVDTILITHGHFDHIGGVRALAEQFEPQVVANFEIATWLNSKGVKNTNGMNKGGNFKTGCLRVTMTHAIHSSSMADDDGRTVYGGEPAGYVLHLPDGRNAYFAGDTEVFSEMEFIRELHEPELAFLPIGDLYTMNPRSAAIACRLLQPRKVIPMHYGTFPALTGTPQELARLAQCEIWPLEPGVPVTW